MANIPLSGATLNPILTAPFTYIATVFESPTTWATFPTPRFTPIDGNLDSVFRLSEFGFLGGTTGDGWTTASWVGDTVVADSGVPIFWSGSLLIFVTDRPPVIGHVTMVVPPGAGSIMGDPRVAALVPSGAPEVTPPPGEIIVPPPPPPAVDTLPPTTTKVASPVPNEAGWNNTDVTLTFIATDAAPPGVTPSGVASITVTNNGVPVPCPAPTCTVVLSTEGTHVIEYHASDNAGNVETPKTQVHKIDKTPPVVSKTLSPVPGPDGWIDSDGSPVTATWSGTDALSGIASCDPPTVLTTGGIHTVTGSCTDKADNVGTHTQPVKIVVKVPIDIKPGSFPNSINLGSRGNIPVGVKTGFTHGVAFDATTIILSAVKFAGAFALPIGQSPQDFDGDGDLDMVYHFKTQETNLTSSSTQGCLTGETAGGLLFKGCDSVRIVPQR